MSKTENTLIGKLLQLQKADIKVNKDAVNPHYNSKYATLDAIMDAIVPELNQLGLLVTHVILDDKVVTKVVNVEDGEHIQSVFTLPEEQNPQKMGSAITYGKRYNISALLNLRIDEDDDANSTLSVKKAKQVMKQEVKKAYKEDDNKPRFNDPELGQFKQAVVDGKVIVADYDDAIQQIRKKYKVSEKKMGEKIAEFLDSPEFDEIF